MNRKLSNMFTEDEQQQQDIENNSLSDLKANIMNSFEAKTKKKTVEDTHTRVTFLMDNETLERLNKIAKGKRGLKTMVFNQAMKAILDELEK